MDSVNIELQKILLRRRNKIIISNNKNIQDIFKNNIINGISNIKNFNCSYEIMKCNGFSISLKINDITLEFEDGELKDKENTENKLPEDVSGLTMVIKDETEKIKKQMSYALSLNKNIESLGYSMDEKMFNLVATFTEKKINKLSCDLIPLLKNLVGKNKIYRPLYPNFPKQVIEIKDCVLYLNSLLHYWSHGIYYSYSPLEKRNVSSITVSYKNITIGNMEDLHIIASNLMKSTEAISSQDIEDLKTMINHYDNFLEAIPESIRNKENLAVITNLILTHFDKTPVDKSKSNFTNVTDVLRLAAVMSNQSATLSKVRFKSFSNKERRFLMALLNNCQNRIEDFYKNKNLWERFCERIHPKKYRFLYPNLVNDLAGTYKYIQPKKLIEKKNKNINNIFIKETTHCKMSYKKNKDSIAFLKKYDLPKDVTENLNIIEKKLNQGESNIVETTNRKPFNDLINKNNIEINSLNEKVKEYKETHQRFSSKVENLLNEKKSDELLKLLSQRPGIFSRRLDEMLDKIGDNDKVLEFFEEVAQKVSVKVLLSLKGYFQKRHEKLKSRVFFIKGTTTKIYNKKRVRDELELDVCEKICHICEMALISHFENLPKMNKVYLSEDFKKQLIPFDVRNSNAAIETYIKGSRFDLSYKQWTLEDRKMMIKDYEDELSTCEKTINENCQLISQLLNGEQKKEDQKETSSSNADKVNDLIKDNIELNIKRNEIMGKIHKCKEEMNIKKGKKIRLFIWWTNTKSKTIDIDLSVNIYNENLEPVTHVSFNSLKDYKYDIYHSGDITNGGNINGNGVAEFIDFDPEQILSGGARYVAACVISFKGISFKDINNCDFGWMEREDMNSNELFEPKTVKQRLTIHSNNTSVVPVVFDCKTREFIWIDATLTNKESCVRIENCNSKLEGILYYYINPLKDNLYNLINLHVQSRHGTLVESTSDLSKGDIAFVSSLPYKSIEGVQYIRPTDLDIILSEYMKNKNN